MNSVLMVICFVLEGVYPYNLTCGLDKSKISAVYEGPADIESYPWMGTLIYQMGKIKLTTSVILITKQIALGSAHEIDKLPKHNLRKHTKVILGQNCNGSSVIRIRDYSYHPDYQRSSYSALAMLQLDMDMVIKDVIPVCPPPTYFINPHFYAMTPSTDCKKGNVMIRKMYYVSNEECLNYYRKTELDMAEFWPTHTACARAKSGGRCIWRSGTALVIKQGGRWRLLGFGLVGPGCQAPARFLDYGTQEQWVRRSIARIGQPAITRLASNHLVMRRTTSNLQRFGPCDEEETKYEMYTDRVKIITEFDINSSRSVNYNITLIHGVEYTCIVFKVEEPETKSEENIIQPKLFLRRWCAGSPNLCYDYHLLEIQFYVEIIFDTNAEFFVAAYGKTAKILEPKNVMVYTNAVKEYLHLPLYTEIQENLKIEADLGKSGILHTFFHYANLNNGGWPSWEDKKLMGLTYR